MGSLRKGRRHELGGWTRIFPIASHVLHMNELRGFLACSHCFYILLILPLVSEHKNFLKCLLFTNTFLDLCTSGSAPKHSASLSGWVLGSDIGLLTLCYPSHLLSSFLLVSGFSFLTLDALVQTYHEQLYVVISGFDLFALFSLKPFLFVCCAHRKFHWQGLS